MRILKITGASGTGKSSTLRLLAKDAKRPITTGSQFCMLIDMQSRGVMDVSVNLETFVDDVTVAEAKKIEDFAKTYPSSDYVLVMVIST